ARDLQGVRGRPSPNPHRASVRGVPRPALLDDRQGVADGCGGGGYALSIWMPTYLRTVRGLSLTSTGGFLIVQILGALVGFLIGSYLADYTGRKGTFVWSAIASFVMLLVFLLVPMDNTAL